MITIFEPARWRAGPPALATGLLLLAAGVLPARLSAQTAIGAVPIDRWLVSERLPPGFGEAAGGAPGTRQRVAQRPDPLEAAAGAPVFPDRDLVIGPSYWKLVRRDGERRVDLSSFVEAGEGSVLVHAYVKSPEDRTVRVAISGPRCPVLGVWLNGQSLTASGDSTIVRLAGGWNTLLVSLAGSNGCAPVLDAALLPSRDVGRDGPATTSLQGIRVQASKPPGVRRSYPESWLSVGAVTPGSGLSWRSGGRDLLGYLTYTYTAWGRPAAAVDPSGGEEGDERPAEPPAVDVNGAWALSLFSPTGVERSSADFAMAEDGTLTGEVRRTDGDVGLYGSLQDGWVSGNRIAFTIRFSPPRGRSIEARLEGVIEGDGMRGTIGFGGGDRAPRARIGDFEPSWEAHRVREGDEPGEARDPDAPGEAADPIGPADRPPGERSQGRPGALGAGADPSDALRARMRSRLLPPREPTVPAPDTAMLDVRAGGERIRETVRDLESAVPATSAHPFPFRTLREAALSSRDVELRARWGDRERELRRALSPARLLELLHRPIELDGWTDAEVGTRVGLWIVPETLAGFDLRVVSPASGTWRVNGEAVAGSDDVLLCSPCRRGAQLEISVTGGSWDALPRVEIVGPGYPDAAGGPGAPAAARWLEELKGDNRGYRELLRRHAGGDGA